MAQDRTTTAIIIIIAPPPATGVATIRTEGAVAVEASLHELAIPEQSSWGGGGVGGKPGPHVQSQPGVGHGQGGSATPAVAAAAISPDR